MDIKHYVEQFYTLWTQDYWRDELFTIFLSKNNYYDILVLTAKDFNPPLFYFLTKTIILMFGDSPFYLRQIPFLFHLLSALSAYKLARLFTSKLSAILYSLLILTNPFLFFYAFELRPYSAVVFIAILSCYLFFAKHKFRFILTSIIGLYTHTYYLVFFCMFFVYQALHLIYKYKEQIFFIKVTDFITELKPLIFKQHLMWPLVIYLPWVPVLVLQTISKSKGFWLEKVDIFEIFTSIATYLAGFNYIPIFFSLTILLIFLVIISFGIKKVKLEILKVAFVFGLFPIVLTILISTFTPIFTTRYLIFVIPFLFIFFIGILDSLQKTAKNVCLCLLLIVGLMYLYIGYTAFIKPTNYRYGYLAYTVLEETKNKPEQVITTEPIHFFGVKYYFAREGIKAENIKFFNLQKEFPHFIGDVVLEKTDIIDKYPEGIEYIYLGKEDY